MFPAIPHHYFLHLEPNLKDFTFRGYTEIEFEAENETNFLQIHAKELEFQQCRLLPNSGKADKTTDCKYSLDPQKEEARISLPKKIKGIIKLRIEFTGQINDQLMGWYRSRYQAPGSTETQYIAVTQFEERDARRAFPCVDHPAYKATFDIEFVINDADQAISNTPIIAQKPQGNGKKLVKFQTTPKMCTYILFFGVGKFEFIEDASKQPLVRVAGPPGRVQYGKFGLDVGRKSINFCEEYMGIPYPLPKIDHIAVADFAFGAMENWGAITYRENLLLVYPGKTSKPGLVRLASVIAHETSHMWFGNLVSPADWKYLWLNESFGSYFTYAVPDRYFPDWKMWDQFILKEMLSGLERDSLDGTVAIELPEGADGQEISIDSSTAPIIYNKGASVLRMLVDYLGEDKFKTGTRHYMNLYKYQCATSPQFWEALEEATSVPVKAFAKAWVHQAGYPIVNVQKEGDKLLLRQERFRFSGSASLECWLIPVKIICFLQGGKIESLTQVMDHQEATVALPPKTVAVKVNAGQIGVYRAKYESKLYENLLAQIIARKVSPADRFGIENDAFSLLRRGDIKIQDYLSLIEQYYAEETDPLVLIDIAGNLRLLALINRTAQEAIKKVGLELSEHALRGIGMIPKEVDSVLMADVRNTLLWTAYMFGSKDVAIFSKSCFEKYTAGGIVDPDILSSILRIGADSIPGALSLLQTKMLKGDTPEPEKMAIYPALGQVQQIEELKGLLNFVIEKMSPGNKYITLNAIAVNPLSRPFLWDWLLANYQKLAKIIPAPLYDRVILGIVPYHGIGRLSEAQKFLQKASQEFPNITGASSIALELIQIYEKLK